LAALNSKLMTNLNPSLSSPKILRNTLPSKSSILDNDHEPISDFITKKSMTLNSPSMSTRIKVFMQEKVLKPSKKRNPTHSNLRTRPQITCAFKPIPNVTMCKKV
jgi:hypothetical protein